MKAYRPNPPRARLKPGLRWRSSRNDAERSMQGFALTMGTNTVLAIDDAVGCNAQVLTGQVWITAEGTPRDRIVDAGTTVVLESGMRFHVSAFRDIATLLISAPHRRGIGFNLEERPDGTRVLTATAGGHGLTFVLAMLRAAFAAFTRRVPAAAM